MYVNKGFTEKQKVSFAHFNSQVGHLAVRVYKQ